LIHIKSDFNIQLRKIGHKRERKSTFDILKGKKKKRKEMKK